MCSATIISHLFFHFLDSVIITFYLLSVYQSYFAFISVALDQLVLFLEFRFSVLVLNLQICLFSSHYPATILSHHGTNAYQLHNILDLIFSCLGLVYITKLLPSHFTKSFYRIKLKPLLIRSSPTTADLIIIVKSV